MALTTTTLAGSCTANDLQITVTSATGFLAGNVVKIDDEWMLVDRSYVSGTSIPVFRRGDRASVVSAHNALAVVVTGLTSEVATVAAGTLNPHPASSSIGVDLTTYSVNGAIAIPLRDTMVVIDKATAAAMTLAAPGKDQDGMTMFITSTTNAAHVITATSLVNDGATGAPHTTVTFPAFKGAGIYLVALQGLWQCGGVQGAVVIT